MKALIAFSVFIIVNIAWACPNFSGHFTGTEDGERIDLTIVQQDCITAQVTTVSPTTTSNVTVMADGQFRVIQDDDGVQISQAYSWQGDVMTFIMNAVYQGQTYLTANGKISLNKDNNLEVIVTVVTPQYTQTKTYLYVRN